jgi:hypothetical protein
MRRTLLPILIVLSLSIAPPALAGSQTRSDLVVPVSGAHFLSEVCGFEISQTGEIQLTELAFPDGSVITHVRVDIELTAQGRSAYEIARFTVKIDPTSGTVTLTGTPLNIHAPGVGLLLQDAGRVVRDLESSDILTAVGHLMFFEGDTGALCGYFATT